MNPNTLQRSGMEVVAGDYNSMLHNRPLLQRVTPEQTMRQLKPQTIYQSSVKAPRYESVEPRKSVDIRKYGQNREFLSERELMEEQMKSMVTRTQLAQKSPELIINEFKAYTLPKLRLRRLIKMQAVMKGYHVRRFLIPRLKQQKRAYLLVCEEFIRKTLYDKFIPDIVMEVIANNKVNQDLSLYSDQHKIYLRLMEDLINGTVLKMSKDVVREQTDYLVTSILNTRYQGKNDFERDPLKLTALTMIKNFMEQEVYIVAKEAIEESSQQYYKDLQYMRVIKETIIPNTVQSIVMEALDDLVFENYLDQFMNEIVRQICQPLASKMTQLLEAEQESLSLDAALQNYINRQIGDVLIEHLLLLMQPPI